MPGCLSTGGIASLTGLGISSVFQSLSATGINIFAGLFAHHFSKDGDTELNQPLEKTFQKAIERTIESVKKDFIADNLLDVPWWRAQSIEYGFDIPSYDENYTFQKSLEQNFFQSLLTSLNDEKSIKEVLAHNQELNLSDFLEKLINKEHIKLPEFRMKHQASLVKALVHGFKDRFMFHFVQNLIKDEPARKAYQTQLLQTSVNYLSKIDQKVDKLLDLAKFHKISLSKIDKSINKKHEELIGEFQKLHDEFLQQFSLNLITFRNISNDIRDQFRFDSLYTTFQGRIQEIGAISDFLFDSRMFSFYMVTGPGGAGKSRLANECCVRAEGGSAASVIRIKTGIIIGILFGPMRQH